MENQDTELEATGLVELGDDEVKTAVYEIGYHLVPTISEDELAKSVEGIMSLLKEAKVTFVGERFPAKMQLAYPITRRSQGKSATYDSAYFGWVAFEAPREAVAMFKSELDKNKDVLRFIIVRTDREAVAAAMTGAVATSRDVIGKPKRDEEGGGEMSETALDEALEVIEKEDTKVE